MIGIEITGEMLENAASRMNMAINSAEKVFMKYFPEHDFAETMNNNNLEEVSSMYESLFNRLDDNSEEDAFLLLKVLGFHCDGLYEEQRHEAISEDIHKLSFEKTQEFISFMRERGVSFEDSLDEEVQVEMFFAFTESKNDVQE